MVIKKLQFAIFIGVFILGLILRVYTLDKNPPGFFCDEAAIGYDAYKILQTGKDQYGVPFPIFFRSLGDYKPPLAIYSTIPFIKIFGLTETGARLQSVFYGMLTLVLLFLIGKEMISITFGVWAMLMGAIMPWLIHYNRVAFDYTIYIAFFLLVIYLFLKAKTNRVYIIPAFVTSAITIYTYQPAKLLAPLLLFGLMIIFIKSLLAHKKETILGLILFFLFSLPFLLNIRSGDALVRYNLLSVFSTEKPLIKASVNYFTQLSPTYLFTEGEPTFITRHFINGFNPLLLVTAPFLLTGFIYVLKSLKQQYAQILLFWTIIYPIAGALTKEGPFTGRDFIGAPLAALIIALGILKIVEYLAKIISNRFLSQLATLFIALSLFINLLIFTDFYFNKYPLYSADLFGWQYGAREIVTYFAKVENDFDELIMSPDFNSPEIFLKFYAHGSCQKCLIETKLRFQENKKQLFALNPAEFNKVSVKKIHKIIYYPNQKPAFYLVEILSIKER